MARIYLFTNDHAKAPGYALFQWPATHGIAHPVRLKGAPCAPVGGPYRKTVNGQPRTASTSWPPIRAPAGKHSLTGAGCECPPSVVRRYQARLSGPLLDRVDLRVEVEPVDRADLLGHGGRGESTAVVAARVRDARARAAERLVGTPWTTNSEVPGHELRTRLLVAPGALAAAERDLERGTLTARGLDRVLRVAWTVADLRGADRPDASDVAVALELRTGIQRGVPMGTVQR